MFPPVRWCQDEMLAGYCFALNVWAFVFTVIEHKSLSTAQRMMGPECNTASKAQKKTFSSCQCSSHISILYISFIPYFLLHLQFFSPTYNLHCCWILQLLASWVLALKHRRNQQHCCTFTLNGVPSSLDELSWEGGALDVELRKVWLFRIQSEY